MNKKINNNIVIVSHKVVHQPDDDLVLYLNNKMYDNVLHIMHSFANAADRKSKYVWYKKGEIYKKYETKDYEGIPEPLLYLKEFYLTLKWIFASGIVWNIYLGLDGLCVLFGNILRSMGKVNYTIFWAIDFVPQNRFKKKFKNIIYNWINKKSYLNTDEMWDLSPRMAIGRKEFLNIKLSDYKKHKVVSYGMWIDRIKQVSYRDCDKNKLVFLGNLAEYQGLQLVIKALPELIKDNPKIKLTIIGDGEYTPVIKKLAKKLKVYGHCDFLGRIKDNLKMENEIARAAIALAPYIRKMDYISRFSDLGKIKTYIACGVPVLLTEVPWNANDIVINKCGIIISESEEDIENKINILLKSKLNNEYRKNAVNYAKKFNFTEIFDNVLVNNEEKN